MYLFIAFCFIWLMKQIVPLILYEQRKIVQNPNLHFYYYKNA